MKFVTQISGGVSMHPTSDFGHAYAATVQNLANKECKSRLSQAWITKEKQKQTKKQNNKK